MKVPPPAPTPNLSEILNYGFWMRREGYRPSTIQAAISTLKAVAKNADLLNPDTVKAHLASRKVSDSRKEKICVDLARFYKFKGISFQMPRYHRIDTIPFVPQEREVDQLVFPRPRTNLPGGREPDAAEPARFATWRFVPVAYLATS